MRPFSFLVPPRCGGFLPNPASRPRHERDCGESRHGPRGALQGAAGRRAAARRDDRPRVGGPGREARRGAGVGALVSRQIEPGAPNGRRVTPCPLGQSAASSCPRVLQDLALAGRGAGACRRRWKARAGCGEQAGHDSDDVAHAGPSSPNRRKQRYKGVRNAARQAFKLATLETRESQPRQACGGGRWLGRVAFGRDDQVARAAR